MFDEEVDFGSGAPGRGRNVWLWARRFGRGGGPLSEGARLEVHQKKKK